jgi:anthranilate synthase
MNVVDKNNARRLYLIRTLLMTVTVSMTLHTSGCYGFIVPTTRSKSLTRRQSSNTREIPATVPNFNGVEVAKTGGKGVVTASEKAAAQNLSLGAPRGRPTGGHFLTKGGIQVTANVAPLEFSKSLTNQEGSEAVIERLIEKLDSHKGVLLTSSYEFPGRYARWSLGFIDPPIEVSGKADKCTIKALNDRGKLLLPAVEIAMQELKQQNILAEVKTFQERGSPVNGSIIQIDVTVVPPPEVGTFNEEERSRQVRICSELYHVATSC